MVRRLAAATPKKATDKRDLREVDAEEDIQFDPEKNSTKTLASQVACLERYNACSLVWCRSKER